MKEFELMEYTSGITTKITAETLYEAEKFAIEDGHRRSLTDYVKSFGLFTTSDIMIVYNNRIVCVVDYISDKIQRQDTIIARYCPELLEAAVSDLDQLTFDDIA